MAQTKSQAHADVNTQNGDQPQLNAVIPELPPPGWTNPGYIRFDRVDFYALARRCTGVMLVILLYIEDQTRSHPDKPGFAQIPMDTWRKLTGASQSTIEHNIGKAEKAGFIEREKPGKHHDRGGYRLRYGRFADSPLPEPRVRKCQPREASVRTAMPIAALHGQPQFDAVTEPGSPDEPSIAQPQLNAVIESGSRPQLITVRLSPEAAEAAKHCTVQGGCPYLFISSNSDIAAAAAEPPAAAVPTEAEQVQKALAEYGPADLETARRIIGDSRKQFPQATSTEIIRMIHEKAAGRRNVRTIVGLLVLIVPKGFEGYQRKPVPKTRREQDIAYVLAHWQEYPPEEREEYLKAFPELHAKVQRE